MSSQKGNAARTRAQKYQNTSAFKNNKYGTSVQVKKAISKVHDGICQRCKEVLEWKVKYNKYKSLTQPRKCVKCQQKTVKDAYHVMCKPCALRLELCAKCGRKEDIVIPIRSQQQQEEEEEEEEEAGSEVTCQRRAEQNKSMGGEDDEDDDSDSDADPGDSNSSSEQSKASLPDISAVKIQDSSGGS